MQTLTSIQKNILGYINTHLDIEGIPPTLDEIAVNFKYKSVNTVRSHLRLIEKKGFIRLYPGKSRGIQILKPLNALSPEKLSFENQIPVIGNIAAGEPILAEQNIESFLKVPPGFFSPGEYFALSVTGDSMKNIGIKIGDITIIRHQSAVENGEVAAVILEDEATLKRFFKYSDRIVLKSENPDYPDIIMPEAAHCRIRIAGKLAGILTGKVDQ